MPEPVDQYLQMLDQEITRKAQYHDHKEKMAWTAVAFYCVSVVTGAYYADDVGLKECVILLLFLAFLFCAVFMFVHMQFERRWKTSDEDVALHRACNKIVLLSDDEFKDLLKPCTKDAEDNQYAWPPFVQEELRRSRRRQSRSCSAFKKALGHSWCPFKWHKIDARIRTEITSYVFLAIASFIAVGLILKEYFK